MLHYIKQAKNSLANKLGYSSAIVSTMGITVGALICILTLAYLLLVTPLQYPSQDQLYTVNSKMYTDKNQLRSGGLPLLNAEHLYRNNTQFDSSAIVSFEEEIITSFSDSPKVNIGFVTAQWFDLLGATFHSGRGFNTEEDIDSHHPVAVISHKFWVEAFGQQADILSERIEVKGVSYSIIGVLGESFSEPQIYNVGRETQVWLPWDFTPNLALKERIQPYNNVMFVGKAKDGLTKAQIEQQVTNLVNDYWQGLVADVAYFNGWRITMQLHSLADVILGDSGSAVILLLLGVTGLLLIAIGNMVNLFIARTVEQQKNLAIMAAVGVRYSKLFYRVFSEAIILMLLAFVLAIPIAYVGFSLLQSAAHDILPRLDELSFNAVSTGVGFTVSVILAFLFSFISIRIVNYKALNQTLQSSGKGTGVQVSKRARNLLIVSQIVIAVTIIFANFVLIKNAYDEISKPLNFDVAQVSSLSFSTATTQMLSPKAIDTEMRVVKQHLETLPQVSVASRALSPLNFANSRRFTDPTSNQNFFTAAQDVDENYFPMINQRIVSGRNFMESDMVDGNRVVMINETFANMLDADGNAVGKQLATARGDIFTITGVVSNIYLPGEDNTKPRTYLPPSEYATVLLIKFKDGQSMSRTELVKEVAKASNQLLIFEMDALAQLKARKLLKQKVTVATSAGVALISIFLCALGIYGVLSYTVELRRYEFATRMAIGARGRDVLKLFVIENSKLLAVGILISLGITMLLFRQFGHILAAAQGAIELPYLVTLFGMSVTVIGFVSYCACYLPIQRVVSKPVYYTMKSD